MASQNDGDDLTAGKTNKAQSGTELVADPRGGHLGGGNTFIFQVKPGLLLDSVDGIIGVANGAGRGVTGTGQTGVAGEGSDVGVAGQGGTDGVRGVGITNGLLGQGGSNGALGRGIFGVNGQGTGIGVLGTGPVGALGPIGVQGDGAIGVLGRGLTGSGGVGVRGQAEGQSTGVVGQGGVTGVNGTGTKQGVVGQGGEIGVQGTGTKQGVVGQGGNVGVSGNSGANGFGVLGSANGSFAAGVRGDSDVGSAVQGISPKGAGGSFLTDSGTAVRAVVQATGPPGSIPTVPGFAGVFLGGQGVLITGPLVVGSLTVTPGGPKSAAVPHPDGSYRLLYCLESPEPWFEDFGEGALTGGTARVTLDPDFAAVVETDSYHVFLTPYGESNGLYVDGRGPTGFDVREQQAGAGHVPFSYRVVARRKDLKAERLQTFTMPVVPDGGAPDGALSSGGNA